MRYLLVLSLCFLFNLAQAQIQLPANMYGDSLHAPFYHGVASFDPLDDRVILWTRCSPDATNPTLITLEWELSLDADFNTIFNTGSLAAIPLNDYTAKIDVTGLSPNTTYYYRFRDPNGNSSAIGRTRTAPNTALDEIQLAVGSCSSIYSGFFNAYRRISERDDLHAVIHLGDYVYDFVDSDEQVRVPVPYPSVPQGLNEWRDLHAYHLLDPDLRAARQQHPFIQIWDNHDIAEGDSDELESMQAFQEWVPIRLQDPLENGNIYRAFSYGNMLDIIMMDVLRFRGDELIAATEYSCLGNVQYDWLTNELQNSTSTWRIIGGENIFGGWFADQIPPNVPVPHDGPVFDSTSWDGYSLERLNLLNFIDQQSINNCLFLSGDAHISLAMNLTQYPKDSILYDPATGDGSIAVEFLSSSISRGNVDETGIDPSLGPALANFSKSMNPHHIYTEMIQHGYGLITIRPDSITADFMYSEILEITNEETLGKRMVVLNDANRWSLPELVTSVSSPISSKQIRVNLFPNPLQSILNLEIESQKKERLFYSILNAEGKELKGGKLKSKAGLNTHQINVGDLSNGFYYFHLKEQQISVPFMIQN